MTELSKCQSDIMEAVRTQCLADDSSYEQSWTGNPDLDRVYLIHYGRAEDRLESMKEKLRQVELLDKTWVIQDLDREQLTTEIINCFWTGSLDLRQAQLSSTLKHFFAMYHAVKNNFTNVLVVEDDAVFMEDFQMRLSDTMLHLPVNYDMLFVGGCLNMHSELYTRNGQQPGVYAQPSTNSRCVTSYLVSQEGAGKLLLASTFNQPFDLAIDQFRSAHLATPMYVYWQEPEIILQAGGPGGLTETKGHETYGHATLAHIMHERTFNMWVPRTWKALSKAHS